MAETALPVIFDSGRGVPVAPYLSYLVNDDPGNTREVMPGARFPLVSRLAPGLLARECPVFEAAWLAQPMFIVGCDERSRHWLSFNRARLLRAGAWGVVAQARSPADFRALQTLTPELEFAPAQDAWLEEQLLAAGISVYPLFIGLDGLAVQILTLALGPADAGFAGPAALGEDRP